MSKPAHPPSLPSLIYLRPQGYLNRSGFDAAAL